MDGLDKIQLEFAVTGCSVVRGSLADVPCLTVAAAGNTILVLVGDPNSREGRKAADMWSAQLCWCADRTTANAIAKCLQAGEFSGDS